jgi:hypothetical protein
LSRKARDVPTELLNLDLFGMGPDYNYSKGFSIRACSK